MWLIMELSLQDTSARNRIRTLIVEGKNIKQIQELLGISPGTWDTYYWRDDKGFRNFVLDCQDERLRLLARKNIEEVANMVLPDTEDPRWLKIKTDTSQFIVETLEKDRFSKKSEDNKDERTPINIQVNTYKKIQNLKKSLPKPSKPTLDK
jgi:hypothetical protein